MDHYREKGRESMEQKQATTGNENKEYTEKSFAMVISRRIQAILLYLHNNLKSPRLTSRRRKREGPYKKTTTTETRKFLKKKGV